VSSCPNQAFIHRSAGFVVLLRLLLCASLFIASVRGAPPVNDDFANALVLNNGLLSGTTFEATVEPGEPIPGGIPVGGSIWWHWTPDAGGSAQIVVSSATPFPIVAVYRGAALQTLEPVAWQDMTLYRRLSEDRYHTLTFRVEAGTRYSIAVLSKAGVEGSVQLEMRHVQGEAPLNDMFDRRTLLEGATNWIEGVAYFATGETGESHAFSTLMNRSVWYEWVVPFEGRLVHSTLPGTTERIRFSRGSRVDQLQPVTSSLLQTWLQAGERIVIGINRWEILADAPAVLPRFGFGIGLDPRPGFVVEPSGVEVALGRPLNLVSSARGQAPVAYQWYKGDVVLPGDTAAILSRSAFSEADGGIYRVVASNGQGAVTSAPVVVTLRSSDTPFIEGLPGEVVLAEGDPLELAPDRVAGVPASGLFWERERGTNRWFSIPGGTNLLLRTGAAHWEDAGRYRLTASNHLGADSRMVMVRVIAVPRAPLVLDQPRFLNVLAGASVEVPVLVPDRSPIGFLWRTNGVPVPLQVMPALKLGNLPTGTQIEVEAIATNAAGSASVTPFTLRIVGTNLFFDDFPNGTRRAEWTDSGIKRLPRHGAAELMVPAAGLSAQIPAGPGPAVVGADFWAIGSWDGDHGQWGVDSALVRIDQATVLNGSFSNNDGSVFSQYDSRYLFTQPYPAGLGDGAFDPGSGSLGPDPFVRSALQRDTLYRLRHRFETNASTIRWTVASRGMSDEALAIASVYATRLPADLAWIEPASTHASVLESAGSVPIQIQRGGNLDVPVEVRFRTIDQGAVDGREYVGAGGVLKFAPGQSNAVIEIGILDNPYPNRVRSFGLWLLDAGTNGVFTTSPYVGISILDDESTVRLTTLTESVPEGVRTNVAMLTRSGDLSIGRGVRLAIEAEGGFAASDLTGWRGTNGVRTNSLYLFFPPGETTAVAPDRSMFPEFAPPTTDSGLTFNLIPTANSDPEAPNPYRIRLVWPRDLVAQADGSVSEFVVVDNDLTDALRNVRLVPDASGKNLMLQAGFSPLRVRIAAQASDDLKSWTDLGALNARGQFELPPAAASHRWYRLVFRP
jgi:Calx-beta domain